MVLSDPKWLPAHGDTDTANKVAQWWVQTTTQDTYSLASSPSSDDYLQNGERDA